MESGMDDLFCIVLFIITLYTRLLEHKCVILIYMSGDRLKMRNKHLNALNLQWITLNIY